MNNTLFKEVVVKKDTDFVKDIIQYLHQRMQLESYNLSNRFYHEKTPRELVITVLASLCINAFKSYTKIESTQREEEMIIELMKNVSDAVVMAIVQRSEAQNVQ